jgi:hypothetical protein
VTATSQHASAPAHEGSFFVTITKTVPLKYLTGVRIALEHLSLQQTPDNDADPLSVEFLQFNPISIEFIYQVLMKNQGISFFEFQSLSSKYFVISLGKDTKIPLSPLKSNKMSEACEEWVSAFQAKFYFFFISFLRRHTLSTRSAEASREKKTDIRASVFFFSLVDDGKNSFFDFLGVLYDFAYSCMMAQWDAWMKIGCAKIASLIKGQFSFPFLF